MASSFLSKDENNEEHVTPLKPENKKIKKLIPNGAKTMQLVNVSISNPNFNLYWDWPIDTGELRRKVFSERNQSSSGFEIEET